MRKLLLVLVVVLVNLPAIHQRWTDHQVDANGVDVEAVVVDGRVSGDRHLVDYRLPEEIDTLQRVFSANLEATTYSRAIESERLAVRVVPDKPGANRPYGEVPNPLFVVVALGADLILLLVAGLAWHRRRKRPEGLPPLSEV